MTSPVVLSMTSPVSALTVWGGSGRGWNVLSTPSSDFTARGASGPFDPDDSMSRWTVRYPAPTTGAIARDDEKRPPQHPREGTPGRALHGVE